MNHDGWWSQWESNSICDKWFMKNGQSGQMQISFPPKLGLAQAHFVLISCTFVIFHFLYLPTSWTMIHTGPVKLTGFFSFYTRNCQNSGFSRGKVKRMASRGGQVCFSFRRNNFHPDAWWRISAFFFLSFFPFFLIRGPVGGKGWALEAIPENICCHIFPSFSISIRALKVFRFPFRQKK